MRNQSQTRCAQTVSLISHNADFCELRISKTPANAHKIKYFSALVIPNGKYVDAMRFAVAGSIAVA